MGGNERLNCPALLFSVHDTPISQRLCLYPEDTVETKSTIGQSADKININLCYKSITKSFFKLLFIGCGFLQI